MALTWVRLYSDLLNSRKFHQLSDTLKARLILLWCLTAKFDGVLPTLEDIAFSLRLPLEDAEKTIDELKAARFLDESDRGLIPHDWNEHQHVSDISTGRVKRFRKKSETEVRREGAVSRNGSETPVKRRVRVQEQNRADTEQIEPSALQTAAAWDVASGTFELVGEERKEASSNNGPGTPRKSLPNAETETVLDKVSRRIHERHPLVRRCGLAEVKKLLRAIAHRVPAEKQLELLGEIDENHAAWCSWPEWQKDEGQFAKGLANWLAPSKDRWKEPPPRVAGPDNPEPLKLMM